MREWRFGASAVLIGSVMLLAVQGSADASRPQQSPANASQAKAAPQAKAPATAAKVSSTQTQRPIVSSSWANTRQPQAQGASTLRVRSNGVAHTTPAYQSNYRVAYGRGYGNAYRAPYGRSAYAGRGGGMSCVPYARSVTGMNVSGNAWQWWYNAAGQYARGHVAEAGSVLAFRNNMRMPMGHVAVITHVENSRVVMIDHANWPVGGRRGSVSRGVAVVDVSDRNDWSAVRVSLGNGDYGSVYPTHGFIYNRPDNGALRMATHAPAPMLALNAPPRDLRGRADRERGHYADRAYEEVAEAPAVTRTTTAPAPRVQGVIIPGMTFNGGN